MTLWRCGREKEIAGLMKAGRWPGASDSELRAHAEVCRRCGELVLVTQAFQAARAGAVQEARLDSPGLLWWRAQLRRRNEAVERIGRPVTGAQVFALAVNLVVAAGLVAAEWRNGMGWLAGLAAQRKVAEAAEAGHGIPGQAGAVQPGAGHVWQIWLEQAWSSGVSAVNSVASAAQGANRLLLVLSVAAFAVLGGVAMYLAMEKEPKEGGGMHPPA